MVSPAVAAQPLDVRPLDVRPLEIRSVDRDAGSEPRRLPDPKQVERIGRLVFLVVAAIIGTQILKSVLGLSLEDALPLLVLAGIAFAVFRKRRGPPQR